MTTWSVCIWLLLYGYCYTDESSSWVKRTSGPKLGINAKVKWGGEVQPNPQEEKPDEEVQKRKIERPVELLKDEKRDEEIIPKLPKTEEKDDGEILVDIIKKSPK